MSEQHLVALGFSEYEARAYVGLARYGPMTGYELAKQTGLPRANVYGVLRRLEERGVVVRASTPEGQRYAAVPPEQVVDRLSSQLLRQLEAARAALGRLGSARQDSFLWNLQGRAAVLEHAHQQIQAGRRTLWIANSPAEAAELAHSVQTAQDRGVRVETLCLDGCPQECGGCRGVVYRYRVPPEREGRWLVVVRDDVELLAAEMDPDGQAEGVRTQNRLFVQLVTWYMRYSIALARALEEAGVARDRMAWPDRTLGRLRARRRAPAWLRHLVHVLRGESV